MSTPFKNILLIGAGGSIGSIVFEALLKEPTLTVTVLRRQSSNADLPSVIPAITVPDTYPTEALVKAFKGQDVVINCMTSLSVGEQYRLIDAAITAGVRRYVPSEYGLNNMRSDAQALNQVFKDKGLVQTYLRSKEEVIEWMSVSCGMWIKWSMQRDFLGMHIKDKRFVFWDDGDGYFSCTTEENTALGLINALIKTPDETKNRNVFLSDFAVTQKELLAEIEKQTGSPFSVGRIDTKTYIQEQQKAYAEGNKTAVYALIETGFVTGRFGGHLEKEGEILNEKLGLPKHSLSEVVSKALASL
jgi:hypothetical protein